LNHAGVEGVEEWALEIGQDGVVGNPKDNLDPVWFLAAADVEAFINSLPKFEHLVVCFGINGLFLCG
jgi:hypothetical protein